VGVNVETLRYYERRGIIAEPDRSLGGHRMYSEETVTTLRVIKAAQHLGFTLDEVAELLEAVRQRHWQLTAGQDRGEARRGGAQDRRPRGHPGQLGRGA
jgi:DNA-binding transcriptional MerR regulator